MKNLILISLIFLTIACADNEYKNSIIQYRALKDENFRNPESSPLSKIQIKKFKGLNYFEVKPSYKIQAKFKKETFPKYVKLFQEGSVEEIHQLVGKISFSLNNKNIILSGFRSANQANNKLFIPFTDLSNGFSTYGAGRYLEAELINDNTCVLDFNLAYHPFCMFNPKYTCPTPPKENFIQDSILAGESL